MAAAAEERAPLGAAAAAAATAAGDKNARLGVPPERSFQAVPLLSQLASLLRRPAHLLRAAPWVSYFFVR